MSGKPGPQELDDAALEGVTGGAGTPAGIQGQAEADGLAWGIAGGAGDGEDPPEEFYPEYAHA